MQSSARVLSELKLRLIERFGSEVAPRSTPQGFAAPGLASPIPKGKLVGVSGPGRTSFALELLGLNPRVRVAWVSAGETLFPTAAAQKHAGLSRVLFLQPQTAFLSQVMTLVQSQLFTLLILEYDKILEKDQRRLMLGAKRAGCGVFILCARPISTLQHQITVDASARVILLRSKAGVLLA